MTATLAPAVQPEPGADVVVEAGGVTEVEDEGVPPDDPPVIAISAQER